jgi:hypothetical protein
MHADVVAGRPRIMADLKDDSATRHYAANTITADH